MTYVSSTNFYMTPDNAAAFGLPCDLQQEARGGERCLIPDTTVAGSSPTGRGEVLAARVLGADLAGTLTLGDIDPIGQRLGGWSLSQHHAYDPTSRVLSLGDGTRRSAKLAGNHVATTIAGTGLPGSTGDGGPATAARLSPSSLALAADGTLYVADAENHRVRKIAPNGVISAVAGTGTAGFSGGGGPATAAELSSPTGLALAPDGSLYIADQGNSRIRRVSPTDSITTVAGDGTQCDVGLNPRCGDGGPAIAAPVTSPTSVSIAPDGSLYIPELNTNRVRWVGTDGTILTVAGGGELFCPPGQPGAACGDGGSASAAQLNQPSAVTWGPDGAYFIAENQGRRVRRVGPEGIINTYAGNGTFECGPLGDGSQATGATFGEPVGVVVGPEGGLYIADMDFGTIRRVGTDGVIARVVGKPAVICFGGISSLWRSAVRSQSPIGTQNFRFCPRYTGEGGPAAAVELCTAASIVLAASGDMYIADQDGHRVVRVSGSLPGFSGNDLAVASADGAELYQFDETGRHLRTLDARSGAVRLAFTYTTTGLLRTITDGDGNVTMIERDQAGDATAIVGPFGGRTSLGMNPAGFLASVITPAGDTTRLGYSGEGLLNSLTNPRGFTSTFTYDSKGLLTKDEDPAGGFFAPARTTNDSGRTVALTSALGGKTTYEVERLPDGSQRRVTTGSSGVSISSTVQPDGSATLTAPSGVTNYGVGPDPVQGMQVPRLDSMIVATPAGLRFELLSAHHAVLTQEGDPFSVQSRVDSTVVNGRVFTKAFDGALGKYTTTTPAGRQTVTTLDTLGRVTETRVPGLNPVQFKYNARGQLAEVKAGARSISYSYDSEGRLASTTDPLSRTTTYAHDAAGRVTEQTLPGNRQIGFGYDGNGNLRSVTPPGRGSHQLAYSSVDLGNGYTPPGTGGGAGASTATYNADRQVTGMSLPDGASVGFTYDGAGRAQTASLPGGNMSIAYSSSSGAVSQVTTPGGGTINYAYDGVLPIGLTWGGVVSGSVGIRYNTDFLSSGITVNGANEVGLGYDADGFLTRAGDLEIARNSQSGLVAGTTLEGVSTTSGYNAFGELTSEGAASSGTPIYEANYTRDNGGRITRIEEAVQGTAATIEYSYDPAGRLSEVRRNGVVTASYEYDLNGNRTRLTTPNGVTTGSYDEQDRLLTYGNVSYSYSNAGRLTRTATSTDTTSYSYDVLGNLTGVVLPDGTALGYLVDGQGRRIGVRVNGSLRQGLLYQGQLAPVAELDGQNNLVSRFVYGTRANVPDYLIKDGVTYRLVTDQLGSVRLVVNVADGAVAQRLDYDEYGLVTQNTNPGFQPFGFAGGIYDQRTGLVRFGARDYDPAIGRWTSKDALMFRGGPNLYQYVLSDPVNQIDPAGRLPLGIVTVVGGAINGLFAGAREAFTNPCATFGSVLKAEGKGFASGSFGTGLYLTLGAEFKSLGALGSLLAGGFSGAGQDVLAYQLAHGGSLDGLTVKEVTDAAILSMLFSLIPGGLEEDQFFVRDREALRAIAVDAGTDLLENGLESFLGIFKPSDQKLLEGLQKCRCEGKL